MRGEKFLLRLVTDRRIVVCSGESASVNVLIVGKERGCAVKVLRDLRESVEKKIPLSEDECRFFLIKNGCLIAIKN